jgi:hypothetical protein
MASSCHQLITCPKALNFDKHESHKLVIILEKIKTKIGVHIYLYTIMIKTKSSLPTFRITEQLLHQLNNPKPVKNSGSSTHKTYLNPTLISTKGGCVEAKMVLYSKKGIKRVSSQHCHKIDGGAALIWPPTCSTWWKWWGRRSIGLRQLSG